MPSEGSVFDGFTSIIAQDADTHPSYLPESVVAECVNRTFRGGINRTRPSIRNIKIVAGSGQSETIVNDIQTGNFQGAHPYRAVTYDSVDGLLISVSGIIYFLRIVNGTAYAYILKRDNKTFTEWNDASLMHTWFVQAEDRVYIQNGYQNPIAWDGKLTSEAYRLNPYEKKMPIGTIMEYAFGRVFVSDKFNNIYASDIIYGNGFTDTKNTENFTEIGYWAEGGAFTTPAMMGNITGMKVMPYIGSNLRGQGELVVLTGNGAFSMDVSIPRSLWNTSNIQRISLLGRGCTSPYVTLVNSELWFRSHDGWAFYSNSQSQFAQYFSLRKLSKEVNKWVESDTDWLKQFASTIYFNNYLISTVSPQTKKNDAKGLHRYHRGMVVLDLDQSATPAPDAQLSFRWNGLWTGIRPTQLITALIAGQKRGFAFSFDEDNKNRLYELTDKYGDDYSELGNSSIESFFITGKYDFNRSGATNKFIRKKLTGGEMWLSEIKSEIISSVDYRSDSNPCWNELKVPTAFGCPPCTPVTTRSCTPVTTGSIYKRYKFNTPDINVCNAITEIPSVEGSEFQIKVNLVGSVTVDRVRLMANIKTNDDSPVGDCPENQYECIPSQCCPERYWDYKIFKAQEVGFNYNPESAPIPIERPQPPVPPDPGPEPPEPPEPPPDSDLKVLFATWV
jgi:hypothetical protein